MLTGPPGPEGPPGPKGTTGPPGISFPVYIPGPPASAPSPSPAIVEPAPVVHEESQNVTIKKKGKKKRAVIPTEPENPPAAEEKHIHHKKGKRAHVESEHGPTTLRMQRWAPATRRRDERRLNSKPETNQHRWQWQRQHWNGWRRASNGRFPSNGAFRSREPAARPPRRRAAWAQSKAPAAEHRHP